ncbi:alpha-2,8-sialyltransferase 8B-like [Branchiostoma lanceolatum]|uniref:alpha-2,8-sialyltransferase 8B-like n=1 Tax=Branchiostoma lanceolatum TaxID=7740 RepID=UPI003456F462
MAVTKNKDASSPPDVTGHKGHKIRVNRLQRTIALGAALLSMAYALIWFSLSHPNLLTRAMAAKSAQSTGIWTFGDLAPDPEWQFNAEALAEVRKITSRVKLNKRLQDKMKKKKKKKKGRALSIGHYSTCAVVGNSGVLLGSGCGAEIDSMDYVIRMDLPVLRGFEKDVGGRTSLTLLNLKTVNRMLLSSQLKNRSQDVYKSRLEDAQGSVLLAYPLNRPKITKALQVYKLPFRVLTVADGLKHNIIPIATALSKKKMAAAPTTGLVSVVMMTTFCDHSYMYGFFPFMKDANNQSIPYHYYPDDKLHIPFGVGFDDKHDVNKEFDLFRDLHRRGAVKMHIGPCGNQ